MSLKKKYVIGPAGTYTYAGVHISALAIFIAEHFMSKWHELFEQSR